MLQKQPILGRPDMIRCALCGEAPCESACPALPLAAMLRSIWFQNEQGAAARLPATGAVSCPSERIARRSCGSSLPEESAPRPTTISPGAGSAVFLKSGRAGSARSSSNRRRFLPRVSFPHSTSTPSPAAR